MLRVVSTILLLCVFASSIDAAVDMADAVLGHADGAHDMHVPHPGGPGSGSGDEEAKHFCHCAVHLPPLAAALWTQFQPTHAASPDSVTYLTIRSGVPPPVRPPKL